MAAIWRPFQVESDQRSRSSSTNSNNSQLVSDDSDNNVSIVNISDKTDDSDVISDSSDENFMKNKDLHEQTQKVVYNVYKQLLKTKQGKNDGIMKQTSKLTGVSL